MTNMRVVKQQRRFMCQDLDALVGIQLTQIDKAFRGATTLRFNPPTPFDFRKLRVKYILGV